MNRAYRLEAVRRSALDLRVCHYQHTHTGATRRMTVSQERKGIFSMKNDVRELIDSAGLGSKCGHVHPLSVTLPDFKHGVVHTTYTLSFYLST